MSQVVSLRISDDEIAAIDAQAAVLRDPGRGRTNRSVVLKAALDAYLASARPPALRPEPRRT
ncbi:hypothetical protein [Lichenibacterium ramalinae]|uniref:Ribbon-helix-helix protein, CopG family n=1 Tax=Lichenibacterium ramalinae TaxID=2316527 RepID=A0A4Q2R6W0_9HYPH|nr:hypothetical protein [Lichenibacterium ramalinae]RYB01443.1 hypothetical protein D3272_26075 [Lichenibacterium ramalinae]